MNNFMTVLEVFGAPWLMLAIFMLGQKSHKWWLFYAAANLPFATYMVYKGSYFYTIMGCILCISGIRNYYIKKKLAVYEEKVNAMSRLR